MQPVSYGGEADRAGARFWIFAPAVFLSAFLIFQIQPLISKHVLPWYGGTSGVWTTCLLVFQALLFAGYAYAHALGRLPIRMQTALHVLLLVVASAVSILPAGTWKPTGEENPLPRIVLMLLATVGLPYFALSATGPLLQHWFWRAYPGHSPYALYALSNAGSLLALVSYPFLVEPNLSTPRQAAIWRVGFVAFLTLCAASALLARRRDARGGRDTRTPTESDGRAGEAVRSALSPRLERTLWASWSASSVILFMAVTNQLTTNVASVPFLWILPLGIYLATFILAFSGPRAYPRRAAGLLLGLALAGLAVLLQLELGYAGGGDFRPSMLVQIVLVSVALFLLCLVCNGELYRIRPEPRHLTSFYLWIAFGGVAGGSVVGVLAPLAFSLYQELHLGMLLCAVLYVFTALKERTGSSSRRRWAAVPLVAGILGLACVLSLQTADVLRGTLDTRRNFFGLLRVYEVGTAGTADHALALYDGSVLHGYQAVRPDLQGVPTVYYSTRTGAGRVLGGYRRDAARRVGIVGLGVGTLATYAGPGDYVRFYEINPDVVDLATGTFSYLSNCRARWDIVLGDARLRLEQEPDQRFDVLVLDAFSSDAIPVHLLTAEAFDVYERHLVRDGVIALHVSNAHLDLSTIVYGLAETRGFHALEVRNRGDEAQQTLPAIWMILSRDLEFLRDLTRSYEPLERSGEVMLANRVREGQTHVRPWTDSHSNLFQILR